MSSTIVNRAPAGSRVWCYECNTGGVIERENVLGIDYGVEVLADNGQRFLLCGDRLRYKCEQIPDFIVALQGLGETEEQIAAFRQAWLDNTEREYQRLELMADLVTAQANNTVAAYIATVKQILNMT